MIDWKRHWYHNDYKYYFGLFILASVVALFFFASLQVRIKKECEDQKIILLNECKLQKPNFECVAMFKTYCESPRNNTMVVPVMTPYGR